MSSGSPDGQDSRSDSEARLAAIRSAESLADLVPVMGADSEHEAYFAAKSEWYDLQAERLATGPVEGLPGDCVVVDGHEFHVHGITHADTEEEGAFLREHVADLVEAGATVYCETGIRPMYFADFPAVCEMDDYRWAMARCAELDVESHVAGVDHDEFEGLVEEVTSLTSAFREAAFELIESSGDLYGERFKVALGDVASDFLMSHENLATGDDFEAFTTARRAAHDPDHLVDLQHYYRKAFLPQPLEREWLERHDPELEIVTHARNERMADYAVYHNDEVPEVHMIVGAAHQPGVVYYLERHRDGHRTPDAYEPVD